MHREELRPATPSSLTDRSESSADGRLLQERLRLFAGIASWISIAFYCVAQLLASLGRENPFPPAGHAAQGTVILIMAGTWLYCRGLPRPRGRLRALDACLTVTLGVLLLLVPAASVPEPQLRTMVMLLAVSLVLYARSIFVPSSALRTLLVSAAAALPLAAFSLATENARLAVWKVMWLAAAVTIATFGSGVIYGLRREVSHARRLGQYTLQEKLGEGGMGVVYLARHAMLRRPTAIKLLRPGLIGETSLRRFEREVQLTAGLSHPNTVSIFDFGRSADGVFYYAMEYLEGLTLDELVKEDGPQPPARVVHVLRQVLGALAEAHGVGLVHRDIKPGNVILCERGGLPDVAKVVDFGLVKEVDGSDGLSREGALVGTPQYLAPEAIESSEVDPRSDLYSLGAVAYFLLSGRHVFEGRTVVEICSHHLHSAPVPPSARLGRPLPEELESWVLACLEKDRERRPRTAAAALAALDRCPTPGDWTPEVAAAWWADRGTSLRMARSHRADPSAATLHHLGNEKIVS